MLNRTQFDPHPSDDVAAALHTARTRGEGSVRIDGGDRSVLLRQIAWLRHEADVVLQIEGVTAENLDQHAAALCALAADSDVPVRFDLDGRLMQISPVAGVAAPGSTTRT